MFKILHIPTASIGSLEHASEREALRCLQVFKSFYCVDGDLTFSLTPLGDTIIYLIVNIHNGHYSLIEGFEHEFMVVEYD